MGRDALTTSTYPFDLVRLVCDKCGRKGQYRRQTSSTASARTSACRTFWRHWRSALTAGIIQTFAKCGVRTYPAGADQREDIAPFGEAAVRGQNHGAALVPGVDELKDQIAAPGDHGQ